MLSAGIGKIPGQQTVGQLNDGIYHQLRSGVDAVRFVGIGNSAWGGGGGWKKKRTDVKVRNVRVMGWPAEGIVVEAPSVATIDTAMEESRTEDEEALFKEYQEQIRKAKARAERFGTTYKEPPPSAFATWSRLRRLRANPEKGFITGIDMESEEEKRKREARMQRFGNNKRKAKDEEGGGEEQEGEGDEVNPNEGEQQYQPMDEEETDVLSVDQAWDNETLVKDFRVDPFFTSDGTILEALATPERIHVFGIDWAAFKQIRTSDIMAYFSDYGPSYVEWLGELSCNVFFEDQYSAARALSNLSQEIPPPTTPENMVPEDGTTEDGATADEEPKTEPDKPEKPDLASMGWRFCKRPLRKVSNDRYGRRGTRTRILMRPANTKDILEERPKTRPAPPPGFTTKRVLGPGSDMERRKRRKLRQDQSHGLPEYQSNGSEHPGLTRGLREQRKNNETTEMRDCPDERTSSEPAGLDRALGAPRNQLATARESNPVMSSTGEGEAE
eukprot:CAMPEP_0118675576 /NCGR_PEP_ID=MMETSP0800-20121206/1537_1 /TAXON_ID=210618 ORGANISM="Striatella unipunctata, Strain CCMP2910" /NCGR_SAMPLE_ID=MMETSP0800 /ASSEMBLY_ACC=CAM_ASM_000638 /LENGTH=499 /DNA_ID=CAMNT_0006570931 /DNA_START=1 /DNA_END=1500 /DNA_ORIENTATION=-